MPQIDFLMDIVMDELSGLLKPSWGAEKWILEGWNQITAEEKQDVTARVDALFKDGLPLELKQDKLFYIYTFSMLAQLEVLAIQVPLKFGDKMSSPEHRKRMRAQLLDEIFHGIVFTKILYLLCSPHALPPDYNDDVERLCNFIREQECLKVAVVLLNLVAESWIEEIFYSLHRHGVAPKVFDVILEDEHRHVCEADLYRDIGLPDKQLLAEKLEYLEDQLLNNLFLQYKQVFAFVALQGPQGSMDFLMSLNKKYTEQLNKIDLTPSEKWIYFMQTAQDFLPQFQHYTQSYHEVEITPIRRVLMTQWDNPQDPTMAGEFNIDVTALDFFGKKYPPETLTTLMLQTISHTLHLEGSFRNFLSHKKFYQSKEAYVGLVVKLPDCGDHIGYIVFENCHQLSVKQLSARVRQVLCWMVYCYKKREQLEQEHPYLKDMMDEALYDFNFGAYPYPMPGNSMVSLSNIGFCGYTQAKSPLRSTESLKFTLYEISRQPVWNKDTQAFEPRDLLPVSISADHRVFDGNLPIPKLITRVYHQLFERMLQAPQEENTLMEPIAPAADELINNFLQYNLETGYKLLTALQTVWPDFLNIHELLQQGKEASGKGALMMQPLVSV